LDVILLHFDLEIKVKPFASYIYFTLKKYKKQEDFRVF